MAEPTISPPATPSPATLFSASEIANRLNRNQTTIWRVIRRLKIQPTHQTGAGYRFYTEADIAVIEASFRKTSTAS